MTTSLKEQLQRLAVPQTSVLVDSKKRASILFDPKEAANKDRKTIFDLAHNGLIELIRINPLFLQFEQTLFNRESLTLERAVETREINDLLTKSIKMFLNHLSPYFMLQPSHMCIEWLIRRYNIHEYNQNEFIALILPYHETTIFVKCIQTMNFRNPTNPWFWLDSVRKQGVPLSKAIILNRAASDAAFLKFVCKNTIDSIKELNTKAYTLQACINFYCTTVIGGLEYSNNITEKHLSNILPSILKGLSSKVIDFTAAAFMILAQLFAKTTLSPHILNVLNRGICAVQFPTMQSDIVVLLILMFQFQNENLKKFPDDCLIVLLANKWLTGVLEKLSKDEIRISAICVPIVSNCLQHIQNKKENWLICKNFMDKLIINVHFKESDAINLIRAVLDNYHKRERQKLNENEIIELNSDDDDDDNDEMSMEEDIQLWYSEYLQKLERQYPTEFDFTIKETMEGKKNISEARKQALKTVLAFRLKSSYSEDSSLIYENLYHHNAENRTEAVKYLVKNFEKLTVSIEGNDMVKESLLDRLNDENPKVVNEVLKLTSKHLVKILGNQLFVDKLLEILINCQLHQDNWNKVSINTLRHLTINSVFHGCDLNRILLGLMPFFMSSNDEKLKQLNEIFSKDICDAIPFLKSCEQLKTLENNEEISESFLKLIKSSKNLPKPEEILLSIKKVKENFYLRSINCSFLLLLLGASFNNNSKSSVKIGFETFELMEKIQKKIKFATKNKNLMKTLQLNKIPLELYLDLKVALAKGINFENINKFDVNSESLQLLLKLYESLITKTLSSNNENEKKYYSNALKTFLEILFETKTEILQFLSNFFIIDCIPDLKTNYELKMRSIKLFNSVAKNENCIIDKLIFTKILLGLNCEISFIRKLSLTTLEIISNCSNETFDNKFKIITKKILKCREEILMDFEQFPLILFILIDPNRGDKKNETTEEKEAAAFILETLLQIVCEENLIEYYLKADILRVLKHIKHLDIIKKILDLGIEILDYGEKNYEENVFLDLSRDEIFKLIAQRFDETTIKLINNANQNGWQFIEKSLKLHKILVVSNGKIQSIGALILDIFEENVFSKLTISCKEKLLHLALNSISCAEDNSLLSSGNKFMKRIDLDGKHIVSILNGMKNICNPSTQKRQSLTNQSILMDPHSLNSSEWKLGITLLEFLQNKKKLHNYKILLPLLFDILKKCLEFEEQTALEYVKQLILSCLLHICQKVIVDEPSKKLPLSKTSFRLDLIVQCIRSTQNPQTHHHALLLLAHCGLVIPEQVLHNIMDIFTFMGSSVVRSEDSFSFQIISNIIESVIPTLIKTNDNKSTKSQEELVVPVLKVFSDIILDVPEHRRLPLYTKLIMTLDASENLWRFLAVLFESHVMHDEKERLQNKKTNQKLTNNNDDLPKRINIALQLTNFFEPIVVLETCIALFTYLHQLPHNIEQNDSETKMDVDIIECSLFDVNSHSAKQVRHYKYIILQFIAILTSSTEFMNAIALLNAEENHTMKPYYQNFIIKILSYIPDVTNAFENINNTNQLKFSKVILHHCYDILDNSISLLSPDMFLVVVHGLMLHQISTVRKKVIELLISKLQHKMDYFENCNDEILLNLLNPLIDMIETISTKNKFIENATTNDIVFIQQISLIAIKLLSKLMALKHIEKFKFILNNLIKITKKRETFSKIILAAIVLAITEISSNLRAHSISHIPKFMPILNEILQEQSEMLLTQPPDNITIAIVTGIQKLYDVIPLFLGSYVVNIFSTLITIWLRVLPYQEHESRSFIVINKLKLLWTKISTNLPIRTLIPNCDKIYIKLMETKQYSGIKYLMKILIECFDHTNGQEINIQHNELTSFFLRTIEFRITLKNYENQNEIDTIEENILDAFVALILKLSESSFRPLYQKVYDWSFRDSNNCDTAITYFLLSSKISESLKSLFVLFAGDFIQDAADLLNKCNPIMTNELYFIGNNGNEKSLKLIENILKTLRNIFIHDSKGFINPHRFDILMQPIVEQLQNPIVFNNVDLKEILLNCISQLAVVVSNDTLWKQLNYQVLLKTRSNIPEVRMLSFNCCIEIARKLGDDFTSLLPETIPFVAELFEDDQINVERNTRKGVQELEKILGETLQKYF